MYVCMYVYMHVFMYVCRRVCMYVCMYACCMFVCEGVVYDSVFLDLDGQNFFEIIALTLAIRWHATCRY